MSPDTANGKTEVADDVAAIGRISVVPTILEAVALITRMRFTAVARVTENSWIACAVHDDINFGLVPGGELVLESTICNEIRQHHRPVVFGHASAHPHFSGHPTPKMYGFESYISIPIFRRSGEFFGTLCAIDPLPAKLDDPVIVTTLELFAQLIAAQLDIEDRLHHAGAALLDAQETARLREQFIAVLGHDLRNPLQAVAVSSQLLEQITAEPRALRVIGNIRRSCSRMAEMIDNILDFARGRLGSGIPVTLTTHDRFGQDLRDIVSEVQSAHPEHVIDAALSIDKPVSCDLRRIAQLLVNLLSNAITHGASEQPIKVTAQTTDATFELSVANAGTPVAEHDLNDLLLPFRRGATPGSGQGLGLGLYICAEIARAHHGTLSVTSPAPGITAFSLKMPRLPA